MTQTASDPHEQSVHGMEVQQPRSTPELPDNSDVEISTGDDDRPKTPVENGHKNEGVLEEERPSKRRKVSEGPTKARLKPESPPWRRVVAEGPSSFTQDGKRKSGRTNRIPLELQPQSEKRQTRGAFQKTSSHPKHTETNGNEASHLSRDSISVAANGTKTSASQTSSQHPPKSPAKSAASPKRPYHRRSLLNDHAATPVRPYRKRLQPTDFQNTPGQTSQLRERRATRATESAQDEQASNSEIINGPSPSSKLPKIKFRIRPPKIPFIHPGLVLKPKRSGSLVEFLAVGPSIPVEEGGLLGPEDGPKYTKEQAIRDAEIIRRVEEVAVPGGLLGPGISSVYKPEPQDQPPEQYAHLDHLNRAVKEFRRLMLIEHNKHRNTAKKLAEACRDEWIRRQPKSSEQLELEETNASKARLRNVIKTLQATWENVRVEVNRRRLVEWEAQEQARVRKALNEAVDISTQKLQARRAHQDSEGPTDEEGTDDEDSDNGGSASGSDLNQDDDNEDRESNMSSTDSEVEEDQPRPDAAEDELLSLEQLRQKYSALPDLPTPDVDIDMADADKADPSQVEDDDTDESTDMDDDMGSSDEGQSSEEDDENESDDDPAAGSLLGFLAPSDPARKAAMETSANESEEDTPMDDAEQVEIEELSLVPTDDQESNSDGPAAHKDVQSQDTVNLSTSEQIVEVTVSSPGRSSQPTPRTTETRPSDVDSASSVDYQNQSRQITESATPQPTTRLRTPVPFLLRGTLREYQHFGLDWLAGLYANNTNGILADEMGLGKTIQTIALLAHLACEHHVWGPHLVIVPTSVMLNWEMEFKKFLPGFKILTYYGTQEERKRKRTGWQSEDSFNVIITSYQLVLQDQQVFKRRRWHYMILDEAHNIKNFQSQRWQTMLTFNTRARLLLTGTPLQNNLTELWSLLYFLMPSDGTEQGVGGFANLKEFQDWFKKPSEQILEHGREQMDDESRAIISKLHKVLRPYLLRRLKADVEKQMPAKYEHVEFCRLSKRQRELYDSFLNREDTRGTLAGGNYLSIVNCLMQLRKVCNHPDLFLERSIMTSFPMEKSAVADFEIKDLLVRRRLLRQEPMSTVSLDFLNLVPTKHEDLSGAMSSRSYVLSAHRTLMDMREAQRVRAQNAFTNFNPSTVKTNLVYLESAARWGRFEELQHCVYLNALRRQQKPIYGRQLVQMLTLGVNERPLQPKPNRREKLLNWLETSSPALTAMVPTVSQRATSLDTIIQKFACVTPPVVARDMTPLVLTPRVVNRFQSSVTKSERDPFHEARMRLSIQFPDKRLLQFDCGKLQALDKLLRKLQAGGHRALIFTQMTKVLDILEQFLNIHGHKYLRLDGATKIEQRQILTDRFNNDTRILAFILSSRSGGLGINLTGADTVIFYDLDWNPAMDKQCTDRAHRIGQTRDVHIYRLVSEHTIEANILRKANQKRMLDDVVIQEGEFTTDYFNKISVRDVIGEQSSLLDGDEVANAAMDRVLGGGPNNSTDVQRVLAHAEDREDVAAAKIAEREIVQTDAADFDEKDINATDTPAGASTPGDGLPTPALPGTPAPDAVLDTEDEDEVNAWGAAIESTDDYMLNFMFEQLKDAPVELPKDRSKSKRGKDGRHRSHRAR
ncbi:SNF2 family domain-containing protein [Phlyctema vagabunda]|uniref:DNA helicase n=1 Tax=Phlyctema vagabunda TaxID=108571 RepID=A0ABR4PK53_9HELO